MNLFQADQNLVRHLSACETMGSATTICSDKTGTLTTGRMSVVRVGCGGIVYDHEHDDCFRKVPETFRNVLSSAVVINSSFKSEVEADAQGRVVKSDGNDTECAMLLLANNMMSAGGAVAGGSKHYGDVRKQYPLEHPERLSIPFSSERKMMSTIVPWDAPGGRWGGGGRKVYRLFTKGAADFVLKRCGSVMNADGSASPLTADRRAMLEEEIAQFAGAGLRTLGVAYRDFDQQPEVAGAGGGHGADEWQIESKLTLVGLIGMEDHVRPEVPEVRNKIFKIDHRETRDGVPHAWPQARAYRVRGCLVRNDHVCRTSCFMDVGNDHQVFGVLTRDSTLFAGDPYVCQRRNYREDDHWR